MSLRAAFVAAKQSPKSLEIASGKNKTALAMTDNGNKKTSDVHRIGSFLF